MVKGAGMISSLGIRTAATLFALSGAAFGQNLESDVGPITSAIAYIPPLAQAVLLHDPEKVSQALETGAKVDEAVRAKDQARAGFPPLILAAALSEPHMAKMLIGHGSRITVATTSTAQLFGMPHYAETSKLRKCWLVRAAWAT
jgi:hypothetical protein